MTRPAAPLALLIVLLAGCTSGLPTATPTGGSPGSSGTLATATATGRVVAVTDVVDGDTIDVRYRNGTTDTVRLLGIDAPETGAENAPGEFEGIPDTDRGREWLARWGGEASAFLRDRIEGERVRIVTDDRADRRGEYGRLLAYVYHEGENLNLALLEGGYARLYDSAFTERDRFAAAEERARAANRGLWGFEEGTVGQPQMCEPPSTHSVSPVT